MSISQVLLDGYGQGDEANLKIMTGGFSVVLRMGLSRVLLGGYWKNQDIVANGFNIGIKIVFVAPFTMHIILGPVPFAGHIINQPVVYTGFVINQPLEYH